MTSDDDGFLSRWSRRKQAARQAPPPVPATPAPPPAAVAPTPAVELDPAVKAARELLDGDMPAELRRIALRGLWTADPGLAAMDCLDLHNVDCTAATVGAAVRMVAMQAGSAADAALDPEAPAAAPEGEADGAKDGAKDGAIPTSPAGHPPLV